ncbi:hypothetical protein [Paenibacillus amylolyticus]|uniref:hypothetical protein n=1 Tax=Paenibacillus amylolyticus TaxID=1451 RepID=UPI00344FD8F0
MNLILEALYNGRLRPDEMMMPTHPEKPSVRAADCSSDSAMEESIERGRIS